jgi:hypothetical protein
MVKATFEALRDLRQPEEIAERRGKILAEIRLTMKLEDLRLPLVQIRSANAWAGATVPAMARLLAADTRVKARVPEEYQAWLRGARCRSSDVAQARLS